MFRRFMIVCWVVLAITACASAVGWALYKYHYDGYRDVIIRNSDLTESSSDAELHDMEWQLEGQADLARAMVDDAELLTEQIASLQRAKNRLDDKTSASIKGTTAEQAQNTLAQVKEDLAHREDTLGRIAHHSKMLNRGAYFGVVAGLIALALLSWNIVWHIGHWIWMGRKAE